MNHTRAALFTAVALVGCVHAGPFGFGKGIGSAMYYGPYTGGHRYSYNTAYSYGLSFNAADSWRRDPIAYPAGIYPYRPDEKPILHRAWPVGPVGPPISVTGEDGLPVLAAPVPSTSVAPLPLAPAPVVALKPVPAAVGGSALIKFAAPEGAEVYVEKERVTGDVYQTPPLEGRMQVYSVRAKWLRDGREVEQFRVVGVRPGETARLTFGP
ncbi:MAG: hypothetical protein ACRC33_14960 [Gemmataceae bacterium]